MINLNFEIHWIGEDNCSIFQRKSATELTELSVKHVQTSSNVDAIFFSTKKHDNRHLVNRKALSIRGFRFVSKQFYILDFWIVRNGCFFGNLPFFRQPSGRKKSGAVFISTGNRFGRLVFRPFVASPSLVSLWNKVTRLGERGWNGAGMQGWGEGDKNC